MNFTILVVDDAVENIQILKAALEDEYKLKVATNGRDAIKIANKFHPDIILLDVMMPDMSGYEVAAELKKNLYTSNIPILFVTVKGAEMDEMRGFEVGGVDYIVKPISPAVVRARIKTHLALSDRKASIAFEVHDQTKEMRQNRLDLVKRLALVSEYKERNTAKHMSRVANYAVLIAQECGFSDDEIEILSLAAPLHDVGKIGIDDAILNKPGKYTDEEFNEMKKHTTIGANILGESSDKLLHIAAIICEQHHERYDGSGYPHGLSHDEIHPFAKIVAIADVFDALTSERTYKRAWSFDEGFDYVKQQSGKHFDPKMVEAFLLKKDVLKNIYDTIQ